MARSVQEVVADIQASTDAMVGTAQSSYQQLHELKIELARACGHRRTVREWVWTRCLDCGVSDITALFERDKKIAQQPQEA